MAEFVEEAWDGDKCVLVLSGEFDIVEVDGFLESIRTCLQRADCIELDLDAVTFIDSSGLGALVSARNAAREADKAIVVVKVSPSVERLLQVSGLDSVLLARTDRS